MPSSPILKAVGLNISPNPLELPPGSLTEASNVIIRRDDIVESRRGFKVYDNGIGSSTDRAKQLATYKNRILVHYSNKLAFDSGTTDDNGLASFNDFGGTYSETQTGLRIKSIESNGNFYFTTSEGIHKISASSAADLTTSSGYITSAGGIKALDFTAQTVYSQGNISGIMPGDSAAAYRVVWGTRDKNNNLILGSPSQSVQVYNYLLTLILQDFVKTLGAIDNLNDPAQSLITDGNYVSQLWLSPGMSLNSSSTEIANQLSNLVIKLDQDIKYTDKLTISSIVINSGVVTITFTTSDVANYFVSGDKINIKGFTNFPAINAVQTISAVNSNNITFNVGSSITSTFPAHDTSADPAGTPGINLTTDIITTSAAHNLTANAIIQFTTTGTLPTVGGVALLTGTNYYVLSTNLTSTTFQIATTSGGPALNFDGVGTGTHTLTVTSGSITGTTIESYNFRNITPGPGSPADPATHDQLKTIQNYLSAIVAKLQNQPIGVISYTLSQNYLNSLVATTSCNVRLEITIPSEVDTNYFLQIYRTNITEAIGTSVLSTDVAPGDEMQLVYEAYPTSSELTALSMTVVDVTPDNFRGAYLYTNASTGEGILQSNESPPFAKDINKFKNVAFYANTRTKHKKLLTLLPIQSLLDSYDSNNLPKITIATEDGSFNTYTFVKGLAQNSLIQTVSGATLSGKYFLISSANNMNKYYAWFNTGSSTDPSISGRTGIEVVIKNTDTDIEIAQKLSVTLSEYPQDFIVYFVTFPADSGSVSSPNIPGVDITNDTIITYNPHNLVDGDKIRFYTTGTLPGGLSTGVDYYVVNSASDNFKVSTTYPVTTLVNLTSVGSGLHTIYNNKVDVENYEVGYCDATADGNTGFTINTLVSGMGEDVSSLHVLLSEAISPAQAVDETARSLVRIINKNGSEKVYAYYVSGPTDIPGKFEIEARVLNTAPFYIEANNSTTGFVFNPDISPVLSISSISTGSVITTTTPHGLINKDAVIISGTDSTPLADGYYEITYINSTQFSINKTITIAGTKGGISKSSDTIATENEDKPNRVYYSKLNQPEAVPAVNYFDVGARDKSILRIFPLRDTLFVLKEDGLFRISGEVAPFTLSLFDSSCILTAPDSVAVANNNIYAWTTQGIQTITESGVMTISRPIDIEVLKVSSSSYTNFKTATWGVGYDSDNSYTVYTVQNTSDTVATFAYRFSNLTNSWTKFNLSKTCGIVNFDDDKLYMGCADINSIEQERKSFSRYDYADREYKSFLGTSAYFGTQIKLTDISKMSIGDVITQTQSLNPYLFNSLLMKLDLDPGFSFDDYESQLLAKAGDNMRIKLEQLATKLDSDVGPPNNNYYSTIENKNGTISSVSATNPAVIYSPNHGLLTNRIISISGSNANPSIDGIHKVTVLDSNHFSISQSVTIPATTGNWSTVNLDYRDLEACYNQVITKLNAELKPAFGNYLPISSSNTIEAIITSINSITKVVTLNLAIDFIVGDLKHYKAITTKFTYAPNHFQNPLTFKHFREMTMMFINKAFTKATIRIATDLLPQLLEIPFNGDGNGIFGYASFGQGFFGGNSHPVPFRTYIPRQCQRCRFIVVQFEHSVAREQYGITGMTLTGDEYSIRAYR